MSLRSAKGERDYQKAKRLKQTKPLHKVESIVVFSHWRVVPNEYPYDGAYQVCHMLLPKRPFADRHDMSKSEARELYGVVWRYLEENYDQVVENTHARRSVLDIFHLHLLTFYNTREEMRL